MTAEFQISPGLDYTLLRGGDEDLPMLANFCSKD